MSFIKATAAYRKTLVYKTLIVVLVSISVLSGRTEGNKDSTSKSYSSSKKVILSLRGGYKFAETTDHIKTKPGLVLNAGITFYIGKNFFLKPQISFWQAERESWYAWENETMQVKGYMIGLEYVVNLENMALSFGFAPGYFKANDKGMTGVLLETGFYIPLKENIAFYIGGAYQPCGSIDWGGEGVAFSPIILNAGFNFRVK